MHGIIVFPESIRHDRFESFDPISAGFIEFLDNDTVRCFGESVTLKLKPNPDDSRLATKQLLNKFRSL